VDIARSRHEDHRRKVGDLVEQLEAITVWKTEVEDHERHVVFAQDAKGGLVVLCFADIVAITAKEHGRGATKPRVVVDDQYAAHPSGSSVPGHRCPRLSCGSP
jgi:hypothetical protein